MRNNRRGSPVHAGEPDIAGRRSRSDPMADEMNDATQAAQGFGDQAKRAGETMRASGEKAVQNGSAIGVKLLDQAESNTQQAFAAMRAAAQAKDLGDVMRIQSEFLRDAGARSMSQAREIGELIMQFGRDAVTPMRGG
jgi:hypothetical protein